MDYKDKVIALLNSQELSKEQKEKLELIFPELKESEVERIVKELLTFFRESIHGGHILTNKEYDSWIAWLEKQGKKPIDKIQLGKKYKCVASPRYSTFMLGKIYKPEDKFLCSLMNFCSDCFEPIEGEQKPADTYCQEHCKGYQETGKCFADGECKAKREAEQKSAWSEEDENAIQVLKNIVRHSNEIDENIYTNPLKEKLYDWLNSLKDRVQPQPKQEWSEEDNKHLERILKELENQRQRPLNRPYLEEIESDYNWLNSIKDRVQLKQEYVEQQVKYRKL